ncbi:MAG TPA: ABC transporter substrate-binding protein [Methylomirabilota bacterium]|nr:ABC transporter substrate-binding protein [Methylomirabilota bacterium]
MKSKIIVYLLILAVILLTTPPTNAQEPAKIWKIGVLASTSRSLNASREDSLWQGLRQLGYVEGKNLSMEFRYADGQLDRLPQLAADLVRLKVDVIVVSGTRVAVAAKQATSTIPIVLAGVGNPVQAGLVTSLTHPGGNVTGVSRLSPDFIGKRVELIKEVIPKTARMAALSNPGNPAEAASLKEIDMEARELAIKLQIVTAGSRNEFESAFGAAAQAGADALLVMPDALFHSYPSQIVELAAKNRLPAMYDRPDFVEAGGLMSYAVNIPDLSRQAARYVDRILKGSKPADLSLEEPTRYELVINLNTAKALGLTIPPSVLVRADKVVK